MNLNSITTKKLALFAVFLILAMLLVFIIYQQRASGKVCFNNSCFNVTLATTLPQREKGLMFKKTLASNQGMLFIFNQEGIYNFWMKNTLIPLDMIWIDKNDSVVFIASDVLPCKQINCPLIEPSQNAIYVLEVNAGVAKKIGLGVGDKLKITK